jgi:hypothetical protein
MTKRLSILHRTTRNFYRKKYAIVYASCSDRDKPLSHATFFDPAATRLFTGQTHVPSAVGEILCSASK